MKATKIAPTKNNGCLLYQFEPDMNISHFYKVLVVMGDKPAVFTFISVYQDQKSGERKLNRIQFGGEGELPFTLKYKDKFVQIKDKTNYGKDIDVMKCCWVEYMALKGDHPLGGFLEDCFNDKN